MNVQLTDKIETIFKSTLQLIKENGFHGTPMSQIAKNSDVAIGTIYHYFPSKENLILELFKYSRKQLYQFIFDEIKEETPYKEQFYIVFKRFCAFHIEHNDVSGFLEQFYNSPYNECIRQQEISGSLEENKLMNLFMKGIDEKHIKDINVQILSSAYIGAAVSYSKTVIYGKVQFEVKQLDDLIDIIWNGVKQH